MSHAAMRDVVGKFVVSTARNEGLHFVGKHYETVVFDDGRECGGRIYRKSRQAEIGHRRIVADVEAHPENYTPVY